MSRKKFSRWCLYFHHYCLLILGQYPFCYDRARRRFRTSYPLLVVTISLKLMTVVFGPLASLRYLESVRSLPISILPVALNFISDEIYWCREVALLVLFLTNASGFRDTLNNSIALEQQLTKHFDVPRGTNRLYEGLVILKIAVASSCLVYFCSPSVDGVLANAYSIMSITLFMKGFFFADQFVICLEMICANLELLSSSLRQLSTELAHVFAGYEELRYCENLNRVAIAHTKIYRQFHSISQLFAAPMLLWLLLLYNGVILMIFLELTYAYLILNDLGEAVSRKLIGIIMLVLFCADIWLLVRISTCIGAKQQQFEQTIQKLAFSQLKDERVKLMVRLLWMQVKHEKMEVWFGDVVRIDHSLILAIFSSTLKYLVLLIQFQLQGGH